MGKDLLAIARNTRYPLNAYLFVERGLEFTARRIHGDPEPNAEPSTRHVTGRDLCYGVRDYAVEQYGLLARTVLRRWHICACEDIGRIVYTMVEAGLMKTTPEDSLHDFDRIFDFAEAFDDALQLSPSAG